MKSITHETDIETLDSESHLEQKVLSLSEKLESIQDAIGALIETDWKMRRQIGTNVQILTKDITLFAVNSNL